MSIVTTFEKRPSSVGAACLKLRAGYMPLLWSFLSFLHDVL